MARRAGKQSLFVIWIVTGLLLAAGAGLTLFNLPLLRERSNLRAILRPHLEQITIGTLLDEQGASEAEREQIRNAYAQPETIDLDEVCWNLVARPTPGVGSAGEPGDRPDGPFNRQQLRDEREIAMPKPAGVYRIFLTGGSFAFSIGSPVERSISRLLEEELNRRAGGAMRFEVWNAAQPSWSSTHERIWATNHLAALEPDLVILLTGTNETHWGHGGLNVMELRTYNEDEFFALVNGARRVAGVKEYEPWPPYGETAPTPPAVVAERFVQNVRLAAEALRPRGVPVLVALQPSLTFEAKTLTPVETMWIEEEETLGLESSAKAGKVTYMDQCFAAMAGAMTELLKNEELSPENLLFESLRDVFKDRSDPIYLDLYHVADKGNALVAQALAGAVMAIANGQPQ